ncbi:MAG: cytochrome c maturation protein CcmE [Ignavibacteriae bacterium]|nr:cytochrome c maturation protein CcmE [Ignavibacteriota bacterium]
MTKQIKLIIGSVIVIAFIVVGFISFMGSKIEYANFQQAQEKKKTVEVRGVWQKDKETHYDAATNMFTFYMKDENNTEMKVMLNDAKPNNFETAGELMIVAKGKVKDGVFYADNVLTKCPSKYEGTGQEVKNKQ